MKHAIVFISASRDWMESRFMFEFIRILPATGWEIATCNLMGHCAADRHNEAFNMLPGLEKMWNKRFNRVLFMDSDQYYPADYWQKILAHTEPVVASYSVSRYAPYVFGRVLRSTPNCVAIALRRLSGILYSSISSLPWQPTL